MGNGDCFKTSTLLMRLQSQFILWFQTLTPYWLKSPQTVLDLKDACFCIPLHSDSQFLFTFEDPTNPTTQLTWTVLPQGFRDSPHLFGQVLCQDLSDFSVENFSVENSRWTIFYYVLPLSKEFKLAPKNFSTFWIQEDIRFLSPRHNYAKHPSSIWAWSSQRGQGDWEKIELCLLPPTLYLKP